MIRYTYCPVLLDYGAAMLVGRMAADGVPVLHVPATPGSATGEPLVVTIELPGQGQAGPSAATAGAT